MGRTCRSRSDGKFPATHENSQGWLGAPRQSLATPKRLGGNNIQQTALVRPEIRPGPPPARSPALCPAHEPTMGIWVISHLRFDSFRHHPEHRRLG